MDVGFIGLGNMGAAIAGNLLRAGYAVTVWNRTPAKAAALVAQGARAAVTPAEAARVGLAITMLADDDAVWSVVDGSDGILAGLPAGGLHISMSTISVALADRLSAAHGERGQHYMSAPVFGRPEAAEAAKLFVMPAGDAADVARAQPLFDAVAQQTFVVGERPSAANLVKLCGNFMIMSAIESLAEVMTAAKKGGVEKKVLLEVLTGTLFGAPVYRTYGQILVEERFRPAGFKAPLGLKDMRLMGQAAEALRAPMPFLSVVHDRLVETIAQEGEDIDWSGIGAAVARSAGVDATAT
jgi:3-hydroxyisobutyrate dehydrogenase-like beta-hydroxyacid dehydrogenase